MSTAERRHFLSLRGISQSVKPGKELIQGNSHRNGRYSQMSVTSAIETPISRFKQKANINIDDFGQRPPLHMTEDQKDLLEKARESISAADLLLMGGYPGYAVSRAYYAMFYIVLYCRSLS